MKKGISLHRVVREDHSDKVTQSRNLKEVKEPSHTRIWKGFLAE